MTSRKIPESAVENLVSDLEGKANVANTVTTNTTQTITASKNISVGGTAAYQRPFQIFMPTSTESNPTENKAREIAFVASEGTGERYEGSLTHTRSTTGESYTGLRAGRLVNGTYKEGALGVRITADGTTFSIAPNTPDNAPANAIVTKNKIANMVTTNTAQTISGVKTFNSGTLKANTPLLLKQNNANEGGQIDFERSNNSVLKANPYIDLLINTIRFIGVNSQNSTNIPMQLDLENNQVWIPSPAANANDTQAATTAWVRNACLFPGEIIIWSAPNPPEGYLICNGAAISRTTYSRLFQVVGTTWGAGDGSTTFNLPNFVGGFIPTSKQQNVTISSTGQPLTYIGTNNVQTTFHNRVDGDSAFWGVVIGTNADSGAYKYLSGLTASSSISGTPNITFCIRY